MSASTVATIGALVDRHRQLIPLLEERLEDNEGKLLPHLVLADVMRWLAARVISEQAVCSEILDWVESEYERGPEEVQGLVVVSGVEMIPDPDEPGSALRDLLGPSLRRVDPWVT